MNRTIYNLGVTALIGFPILPTVTETLKKESVCQFCDGRLRKGTTVCMVKSSNPRFNPHNCRFFYYVFCDDVCYKGFVGLIDQKAAELAEETPANKRLRD